jgi:hypothetical protein
VLKDDFGRPGDFQTAGRGLRVGGICCHARECARLLLVDGNPARETVLGFFHSGFPVSGCLDLHGRRQQGDLPEMLPQRISVPGFSEPQDSLLL